MKQESLIEGNITSSLIKFTIPILFALLLQTAYGMVDLLIVGNFGSVADVSGVSTGSQLITLVTSLCSGLAMGTTIAIGRVVGKKQTREIPTIIGSTMLIFSILALFLMVCIFLNLDTIIGLLNTPVDAISRTTEYIFVSTIGIPLIFGYNILGSIFRGLGDSKTPLVAVGIACVVNIVLDLLFVAGFNMGALGAAIATITSQGLSVVICSIIIKSRNIISFKTENSAYYTKNHIIDIIKLGLPMAMQSTLVSVSFLAITVIINQFGLIYSAAVGLVEKLFGIIMLVPISFMSSLSVFVAQNSAANQEQRSKKGLSISLLYSFIFSAIMFYISFFHGEILVRLFSGDIEVVEAATMYLKGYTLDTLVVPFAFCLSGYFSGLGKTFFVMAQSLFGAIVIRIPITYLVSLATPISLFNIGLAMPIATVVQVIILITYYVYYTKKRKGSS